jgi:acetyltransferase-like isoleucine patch superfamily enzyme
MSTPVPPTEDAIDRWHPSMPQSTRHALGKMIAAGYRISVGDYSYGVPAVRWAHGQRNEYALTIGKYCSIAADVEIYVGKQGRHTTDFLSTYPIGLVHGPMAPGDTSAAHQGDLGVTIGSDVWIGRGAQIMAGTTIGDGAVIGARSLVTSDVPAYVIAVGTPAKPLRSRFGEEDVRQLCELCWWDLPPQVLSANIDMFCSKDIKRVIERVRKLKSDLEAKDPA